MNPKLKKFQVPMRRSANGKVLGVFKGIAETLGWSVCWTRILGIIIMLCVAGAFGVDGGTASLLSVGFFYLLLAMLMRPPLSAGGEYHEDAEMDLSTIYPPRRGPNARVTPMPAPRYQTTTGRRVDLGALDRQVDSLNRRIQRMETIVTDRQYDWDRRMNS